MKEGWKLLSTYQWYTEHKNEIWTGTPSHSALNFKRQKNCYSGLVIMTLEATVLICAHCPIFYSRFNAIPITHLEMLCVEIHIYTENHSNQDWLELTNNRHKSRKQNGDSRNRRKHIWPTDFSSEVPGRLNIERVTFTNGAGRLTIHMENKNELPPYVTPTYMYFYALYAKMNIRWIRILSIKLKLPSDGPVFNFLIDSLAISHLEPQSHSSPHPLIPTLCPCKLPRQKKKKNKNLISEAVVCHSPHIFTCTRSLQWALIWFERWCPLHFQSWILIGMDFSQIPCCCPVAWRCCSFASVGPAPSLAPAAHHGIDAGMGQLKALDLGLRGIWAGQPVGSPTLTPPGRALQSVSQWGKRTSSVALMTTGISSPPASGGKGGKGISHSSMSPHGRQVTESALPRAHPQGQFTYNPCNQG
jgi:hypothetical protein